jgi:imidazolonepropionase-like amidohydrolase
MRGKIMKMSRFLVFAWGVCLSLVAADPFVAQAKRTPDSSAGPGEAEIGTFRLYKFEQAIGEEKYTIERTAGEVSVNSSFEFTDRGTKVPLTSKLRTNSARVPLSLSMKGFIARGNPIDAAVETSGDKIHIRLNDNSKEVARPAKFFFIDGYAPATLQMMLIRYWEAAGRPAKLQTFPAGEVTIGDRGADVLSDGGQEVKLQRFSLSGLTWGHETLWMRQDKLAAIVTVDAEFDHFEAIAPGYESHLGDFVRIAASGEMAALGEISKAFRTQTREELTALSGATLVDGTGTPAVADSVILVRGGKIIAAGPRGKVSVPKNAKIIDVHGKTVIPGLWDMHAHFEQVEWGPVYLAAGVTTVRDCANEFDFITSVRDAIQNGRGVGPHLLLAGIIDGTSEGSLGVQRGDTPEQAREWVHKYHDAGFSQIKIYSSMKRENVEAATAEAHRLGMTVTGHVPQGMNAYDAVNAGMDQINHVTFIFEIMDPDFYRFRDEGNMEAMLANAKEFTGNSADAVRAISFLREHHTVLDPTVALYEAFMRTGKTPLAQFEPGVAKVAPPLAEVLKTFGGNSEQADLREALFGAYLRAVTALHRAGIPLVVGTDQSVPGHSVHRSMELFVQAGFTPMQALQAATIVSARAMGIEKDSGTIETGKSADLVVLGGNPLESISNVRKTERVMRDGVLYDCAPLWKSVGFLP